MAVDPGKLSGIAFAEFANGAAEPGSLQAWEMAPLETVKHVDNWLGGKGLSIVACESFTPRAGIRTWQPDALEIIGALRYVCHLHNTVFVLQSPANAKSFSTAAKLKKLGWWFPTEGGHANDALRHLLLLAVRGGDIDPEELI